MAKLYLYYMYIILIYYIIYYTKLYLAIPTLHEINFDNNSKLDRIIKVIIYYKLY